MRVNDVSAAPAGTANQSSATVFAQAGDHLSDVAARHGTSEAALHAANPELNGRTALLAGEAVKVPVGQASPPQAPARVYNEHPGAVQNPQALVGTDVVKNKKGDAQCAELVKVKAHAPNTQPNNWQKGTELTPENVDKMPPGTPVASGWDKQGYYPNNSSGQHSGIFAGPVKDKQGNTVGFKLIEQYRGQDKITSRDVYFDPAAAKKPNTYYYNAHQYATIKW